MNTVRICLGAGLDFLEQIAEVEMRTSLLDQFISVICEKTLQFSVCKYRIWGATKNLGEKLSEMKVNEHDMSGLEIAFQLADKVNNALGSMHCLGP